MIVIKYGINNEVRKSVEEYPTVNAVVRSHNLRATLGFSDNVEAHVNGSLVTGTYVLRDGDVVTLSTRANSKG